METSFKHENLEAYVHFLGNFTKVNAMPAMETLETYGN